MSKQPAIVVILLGLCVSASAQPAPKKPAPARKPNCGEHYVVGKDPTRKSLTQDQIDEVMKTKVGEVETCWLRVPEDKRKKDTTAQLKIEIDDSGEVQTVETAGVPDDAQRCIAVAAVEWEFPRSDAKADSATYSYSVALHAK